MKISIVTPTYNELGEYYEVDLETNFTNGDNYNEIYSSSYDFNLQTLRSKFLLNCTFFPKVLCQLLLQR